jgi:hypothetical protein
MSDITSRAYPVVTDFKSGDLVPIVRDGSLKKTTKTAVEDTVKAATLQAVRRGGLTSLRPENPVTFEQYFDSTLGYPIWWNGAAWVDASGVEV